MIENTISSYISNRILSVRLNLGRRRQSAEFQQNKSNHSSETSICVEVFNPLQIQNIMKRERNIDKENLKPHIGLLRSQKHIIHVPRGKTFIYTAIESFNILRLTHI
jgi:hypothetical protein